MINRLIEPEEVAELLAPCSDPVSVRRVERVALLLCSLAASFITGAAVPMDGGWTAH